MASYQIPAVEKFDFGQPENWPKWIRRFERFRQASGIASKTEESQVNALVYSMGDKADDILGSFNLSEEDAKKYETVKTKFEQHFVKRRNTIFERAKFNRRKQEDGESVDAFITDVYCLAEHCGYAALHDEMVRDRIVVGIRDSRLSEKMQMDPELTLEKAVTLARQSEAVKKQQATVRGHDRDTTSIEAIKGTRPKWKRKQWQPRPPAHFPQRTIPMPTCTRCGKAPMHGRAQCPAKDATCHNCGKTGHYKSLCKSKPGTIKAVHADNDADVFLGTVHADTAAIDSEGAPWTTTLLLNNRNLEFKIDTGADVTVIPETEYSEEQDGILRPSERVLTGAGQQPLRVCGLFRGTMKRNGKELQNEIYVVSGLRKPLLGRPAIEALGIVSLVEPVLEGNIAKQFPKLFQGLGKLEDNYTIKLCDDSQPFALTTPRRVAIPLLPKVKAELQRMEDLGVISKVQEATDWCAGMVVVPKPNGKVRICVDLTKLNESVCRERHILPSVEQTLAQIGGSKIFSKLDANSGFWQVVLSPQSAALTTFITPLGRYQFNRMPFGITSAPEHFQKRMCDILAGLGGVVGLVDDVLVHGKTQAEHDERLMAVLERISKSGLTLNREKCEFSKTSIKFLGQVIDATGVRPDPEKVRAIQGMEPPSNITELRRFLGMINQLSKFSPHLADRTKPLRDLLSRKNQWLWGVDQDEAFGQLKEDLSSSEVLARYDATHETVVSADASSYGLGAVIRQKQPDGKLRPIAYISRALTETEQRYAQIEKEALGVTWACERFQDYLVGMRFHIETDHKPLIPLLSSKQLDELPIRVQRFRLRLMRFDYTISHVSGKDLCTADTLSRAPVSEPTEKDGNFQQEVSAFLDLVVHNLPATEQRLQDIQTHQDRDPICQKLKHYCQHGWPNKSNVQGPIKAYFQVKDELSVHKGLLLRGSRLVIPRTLRPGVLEKLHSGHQGVTKCRERARQSAWWPGMRKELEDVVNNCSVCCKHRVQHAEPLIPTTFPDYPWQKVASDIFDWKQTKYVLVVDYYSRYIEVAKLSTATASDVITHLRSIFARHGIPQTLMSDNGPQYAAESFGLFASEYGFAHTTSSPKYPQSNGAAERAVKTVKGLLAKNEDPYLALLAYRSTPLENGYSPAELLMGRNLRTTIPVVPSKLLPHLPNSSQLREKEKLMRERQQRNFDHHHRATDLKPLQAGGHVWIPDKQAEGTVVEETNPRSYVVKTPSGTYRRNRRHLIPLPQPQPGADDAEHESSVASSDSEAPKQIENDNSETDGSVRTRSGRVSKPPERL